MPPRKSPEDTERKINALGHVYFLHEREKIGMIKNVILMTENKVEG
jgi:hypothetical protein